MGCCISSHRNQNNSPYPTASPTGATSARNITTTSPPQSSLYTPRPSSPSSGAHRHHNQQVPPPGSLGPNQVHHHHHHHGGTPTSPTNPNASMGTSPASTTCAPNSPLIPIPPNRRSHIPHGGRWTRRRLERERGDFFDTRVTGRPEVWGLVRMVVELVRQGQVSEAQGILDAGACTCPNGEVWRGIFDEKGAYYQVPDWVVIEPRELVEREESEDDEDAKDGFGEEDEDEDGLEGLGKEEKGKGKAVEVDPGSLIKVRARLSDRANDVVIKLGKDEKVGILVKRVREAANLPQRNKLKIGYLGRILHESESLTAQGWCEGHVVNALVFQQQL